MCFGFRLHARPSRSVARCVYCVKISPLLAKTGDSSICHYLKTVANKFYNQKEKGNEPCFSSSKPRSCCETVAQRCLTYSEGEVKSGREELLRPGGL